MRASKQECQRRRVVQAEERVGAAVKIQSAARVRKSNAEVGKRKAAAAQLREIIARAAALAVEAAVRAEEAVARAAAAIEAARVKATREAEAKAKAKREADAAVVKARREAAQEKVRKEAAAAKARRRAEAVAKAAAEAAAADAAAAAEAHAEAEARRMPPIGRPPPSAAEARRQQKKPIYKMINGKKHVRVGGGWVPADEYEQKARDRHERRKSWQAVKNSVTPNDVTKVDGEVGGGVQSQLDGQIRDLADELNGVRAQARSQAKGRWEDATRAVVQGNRQQQQEEQPNRRRRSRGNSRGEESVRASRHSGRFPPVQHPEVPFAERQRQGKVVRSSSAPGSQASVPSEPAAGRRRNSVQIQQQQHQEEQRQQERHHGAVRRKPPHRLPPGALVKALAADGRPPGV
jgi:hypothetical protein